MKTFKKTIQDFIDKDNALESRYLAREIYFTTEFMYRISKFIILGRVYNLFRNKYH